MKKVLQMGVMLSFAGFFSSAAIAATTSSAVQLSGRLVEPAACSINNGDDATVNFGNDILTSNVNGSNFGQMLPFKIVCVGQTATGLKYKITGTAPTGTGFTGSNVLMTSNANLGITVRIATDNTAVVLNADKTLSNTTAPAIMLTPIARTGVKLTGGSFTATAGITLTFD